MDKEILVAKFTKGEDIFSMVTHIVGAVVAIAGLTLGVIFSSINFNGYSLASSIVFGVLMIIYYILSSVYHGLKPNTTGKNVFRRLDRCAMFLLVSGTYTPFILCLLREYNLVLGWVLFGLVWFLTICGIVFSVFDLKVFRILSAVCYLGIAACVIFRIDLMFKLLTSLGFIIALIGIVLYLIGALINLIGRNKKWLHSVCHIFMVLGTSAHMVCILLFVL